MWRRTLSFFNKYIFKNYQKDRGLIYTIGSNLEGKLGINNKSIRSSSSPCLVEELQRENCVKVACGLNHTIAIIGFLLYLILR